MKTLLSLFIFLFVLTSAGFCQRNPASYSIGLDISKPVYFSYGNTSSAMGIGLNLNREKKLGKRFSWTAGIGFNYFSGNFHYYKFTNGTGDTISKNFAILPIVTGFKYHFAENFFMQFQGGVAAGISKNTGTEFVLIPSIGYVLPTPKPKIELALQLANVIQGFGIAENNSLSNGGYGYWSFRIAYHFR